jgi:opacity protein-like surface antigen
MKRKLLIVVALALVSAGDVFAQKYEVALTSGALKVGQKDFQLPRPGFIDFSTGLTYQFSYAQRVVDARAAALYFELPFAGTPRTKIESTNALSPRSYSSIFITPGIKLKLLPGLKYSPYLVAGVGYARFNSSQTLLSGDPNREDRQANRAVFGYGGGIDVRVFSIVSLRGEVRDFVTGTPKFNLDGFDNKQHNTLLSAGVVLRFK